MTKTWVRRIVIALGGLFALIVLALAGVYAFSSHRFNQKHDVPLVTLRLPVVQDSAALAQGRHLTTAISKCVECHGDDLGGKVFIDDPALGRVSATNLTSGTGGKMPQYDDAHLIRAIRRGIAADGRALKIMPIDDFRHMADEDMAALIAYLRALPPVNRPLPENNIKPLARILYTAGVLPMLPFELFPAVTVPVHVPKDSVLAYGAYLSNIGGCTGCHGPGLSGGKIPSGPPDWKPASNLTPAGIGKWTEADFERALRQGVRPDGSAIDPLMPWKLTKLMRNDEMHAVWTYIHSVPAKPFGNR